MQVAIETVILLERSKYISILIGLGVGHTALIVSSSSPTKHAQHFELTSAENGVATGTSLRGI
jgi:hypothetical protein